MIGLRDSKLYNEHMSCSFSGIKCNVFTDGLLLHHLAVIAARLAWGNGGKLLV